MPADLSRPAEIRHGLRGWLARLPLDQLSRDDILLASGEACANAIEHAYAGRAAGRADAPV